VTILTTFSTGSLNDLLIIVIIFMGFHALLHLGEMTQSNNEHKRSFKKLMLQHSLTITASAYSFTLLSHKADQFFEGSSIIVDSPHHCCCPHHPFFKYIMVRDAHFPFHPQLWLCSTGKVPTYSWVVQCMKAVLGVAVAGHSLQSRGATALAISSTPDNYIQARGCWSSES